jgi:iron complex outermembrane recepter protein
MKACALWLSASALAFTWCGTAVAQTTPPPADSAEVAEQGNDEIVVTAQRRNENLMTTPVAASVLSGNQLEHKGVNDVDALQFAMPSVVVNNFGQGNDFNVRGIGKAEHNTQTTTGVITYRDGVPSFPGYVQKEPYFDIANIQVLRGPQGTIVGQNATGGAVFVNTNDPIIGGGVHGYFQAQVGNYSDFGGQLAVNLPIGDTFAARVAVFGERRGGFYNITGPGGAPYTGNNGDLRMLAGRLSLLWKPVEGLSILSKTDIDYLDMGAYPASPQGLHQEFLPGTSTPNPNYRDLFDITANAPQEARDKFIRQILRIEYEFAGGIKFRSVSSYQKANTLYRADLDGTSSATGTNSSFFDDVNERQITQEFNLISPDNQRFTWLLGSFAVWNKYYFKEPYQFVIDLAYPFNLPAFQYKLQGTNPTRSLAAFGQVGFNITDNLKIEAGGRYTDSRSTNHVQVIQYGTPILAEQTTTSDNFSYKVSLGWKASETNYLYAFVATGFRPGGLNVPVGLGLPAPFKPEEVTSYEAGWKANWADGHIRTTVNGFYNSYKNFQVIIGYPTFPTFGIELNVEDPTKIYGFEASAEFRFGHFSLDAGINVLHSSLGEFYASDPRQASTTPCNPLTGPGGGTCIALEGRRQTYAPNLTFNIGAQYEIVISESDKIIPRANFGHVGSQWATLFENPARGDLIEARNILNAQLAWQHDSWTVTAYATNLTNQHYPAALNSGLWFAGPPRQYGVKVLKTF